MGEERFDVIIVGGGLAGTAAAMTLAREGLEVVVIERGNWPGAKNVSGGRLYAHGMQALVPNFAKEAPIERLITKERVSMMTEDTATTVEYSDTSLRDPSCASYSVLRSKFDKWFAEKAEADGAMYVSGICVDELIQKDGKVCGVRCDGEDMEADVVILADGVNSLLAQSIGMKKELLPSQVAVGVKEVIAMDEKVICDRFGVRPGEGAAWLMAGFPSDYNIGGACLYTNKESLSLALVLTTEEIGKSECSTPEMIERVKQHPMLAPLLEGGRLLEYSAHLVSEGGIHMTPTLYQDGVLLAGDAAAFVINLGYTVRGMDFAIESGRIAAQAVLQAREKKDFSAASLSVYQSLLEDSFVLKTLRHYGNSHKVLENRMIYEKMPTMAQQVMGDMFKVDGKQPLVHMKKKVKPAIKQAGGLFKVAKLGLDAMKTL